jgi:hypothetical protein
VATVVKADVTTYVQPDKGSEAVKELDELLSTWREKYAPNNRLAMGTHEVTIERNSR